jgi:hypothetical protein
LGRGVVMLERAGMATELVERIRAVDAARQQLMSEYARTHALRLSVPNSAQTGHAPEIGARDQSPATADARESAHPLTLDEIQKRAAERWLAHRNERVRGQETSAQRTKDRARDYGAEFEI